MNDDILYLVQDTESLLSDIFLSGFHSVTNSSLEQLEQITKEFERYGMKNGMELLDKLKNELLKYKNSFNSSKADTTKIFCLLEFYLKNAYETM